MALVLIKSPHTHVHNGTLYLASSVIDVPDDTKSWLLSLDRAHAIASGPADWSAGTTYGTPYALVRHNNAHWVNTSAEAAGVNQPGSGGSWVLVTYLSSPALPSGSTAGYFLDESGNRYTGTITTVDGIKTLMIGQTPVNP